MAQVLRIDEADDVAVALEGIEASTGIVFEGAELGAREAIPAGHKIALRRIQAGADVLKYGWPIGRALSDIEPGAWVHTHNLGTKLEGLLEYSYHPRRELFRPAVEQPAVEGVPPVAAADSEAGPPSPGFLAYRRPDGRAGVRNELWIIVTVGCVNQVAQSLARLANQRLARGSIEGVFAFPHPYGCGQLGDDLIYTRRALAGLIRNPNCAGALVLGLGCETNAVREQVEAAGALDPRRIRFFNTQEVEDETAHGMRALEELAEYAATCRREPCPASELVLGMKCGGSDGFSGITANPLVGRISDRITRCGGTVLLTEVPEMFGAEQILMDRCRDRATFEAMVEMINGFKQYFLRHNQPVYENPAPGNREGGITTLEEKSLGCIQKGGRAPVNGVLGYGEPVATRGLSLVTAPGNDLVSTTALVAAGATMLLFTTGRGTPLGAPVPTLKIATNSLLARRKPNWMDFDAGRLLSEGGGFEQLEEELLRLVLETASGHARARNETNGMREIAPFKIGVTV
jgi:altronate hydrolase